MTSDYRQRSHLFVLAVMDDGGLVDGAWDECWDELGKRRPLLQEVQRGN